MKALLQRIIRLDKLISLKKTGTPQQFAKTIGISERAIYDYLKVMKEMGAPIKFSRTDKTYHYIERGHFNIHFIYYNNGPKLTV